MNVQKVYLQTLMVFIFHSHNLIFTYIFSESNKMTILWSLDTLLHQTLHPTMSEEIAGDVKMVQVTSLSVLLLAISYPILHKLLLKLFKKYGSIKPACKQVIILHHAMEVLVLSILAPFFTYFMLRSNFQIHDVDVIISDCRMVFHFAILIMFMYMMELAARFENPRPLILFHHILACADGVMTAWLPTSMMLKTASVLMYFVTFESLTFVGLFMYRICPENKYTRKVILIGMILFGISRPFQVLWVGAIAYGSWNEEHEENWQVVFQCVITLILTIIQVYSLKIHLSIWKRVAISPKKRLTKFETASVSIHDESDEEIYNEGERIGNTSQNYSITISNE